jgi:hypothetical protein
MTRLTDDIERSVGLVLGLEKVADIGTLMAILRSPLGIPPGPSAFEAKIGF